MKIAILLSAGLICALLAAQEWQYNRAQGEPNDNLSIRAASQRARKNVVLSGVVVNAFPRSNGFAARFSVSPLGFGPVGNWAIDVVENNPLPVEESDFVILRGDMQDGKLETTASHSQVFHSMIRRITWPFTRIKPQTIEF